MTGLIEYIARELVDRPEAVDVKEVPGEDGATVIELRVAPDDLGKVIGRQGRTARAIRTLLAAAASKQQRRASLEIIE
jgi:predicted RNA-binding protein YlqC (UPF0109 family)